MSSHYRRTSKIPQYTSVTSQVYIKVGRMSILNHISIESLWSYHFHIH